MSTPRLAYCQRLLCSFCGKSADEAEKLIAGPTVFICDECVALCQGIINEAADEASAAPFAPDQEVRIAEIVRGIVADVLRGSDARIQDALAVVVNCSEASIRDLVREEIEDDHALRNARDHAEFLSNRALERSDRTRRELKRVGGSADV